VDPAVFHRGTSADIRRPASFDGAATERNEGRDARIRLGT
jgi:hypothetical protein